MTSIQVATLTADETAILLTRRLRQHAPFFYVRYGDGALECIHKGAGVTCDGERYSPELGHALLDAWVTILGLPEVYIGDWATASFEAGDRTRYTAEYEALIAMGGGERCQRVHFEALLLMRESEALADFYRAVARDSRQKLYMGPAECRGAAKMLGADHLVTPMADLYADTPRLTNELMGRQFDVLLYGAGMAGSIPAAQCAAVHPERTYINLGSAMDPLFRRQTRRQQLTPARARRLLQDLL